MSHRVHKETALAARHFARTELGARGVKLRAATAAELAKSTVFGKGGLDTETITDAVVARDRSGKEWLLHVADAHPEQSKHLHAESGVMTLVGLIPVIGPFITTLLSSVHIAKAAAPMLKAAAKGEAPNPHHRAMLQTGIKHLGLSGLSLATGGLAHHAVAATELASAGRNLTQVSGGGIKGWFKAVIAGLQGAAMIKHHHHEPVKPEDIRVIVLEERPAPVKPAKTQASLPKAEPKAPPTSTGPPLA